MRQRAFGSVDQQHDAVHHRQRAFHLAAEIGMAGGVDDIDLHVVKAYRGVFGHDRNAALALEVHGIHDPFGHVLVGAKDTALVQESVDESCLAVVDVRDDGDVTDIIAASNSRLSHDLLLLGSVRVMSS